MLAIGRAMMARPKVMLLDEPSLGLAPLMVEEIFRIIKEIKHQITKIETTGRVVEMVATIQGAGVVVAVQLAHHRPGSPGCRLVSA